MAAGEAVGAEAYAGGVGDAACRHVAELRAAATDVDDDRLDRDRPPAGHADEGQEGLLLVGQDVNGRAGRGLDLGAGAAGVGGAAEGLGGDELDRRRAELPGGRHVASERVGECPAQRSAEHPGGIDRATESQERRFVVDRDQVVAVADLRDQQMHGGRPEVDRSTDPRLGHLPTIDGRCAPITSPMAELLGRGVRVVAGFGAAVAPFVVELAAFEVVLAVFAGFEDLARGGLTIVVFFVGGFAVDAVAEVAAVTAAAGVDAVVLVVFGLAAFRVVVFRAVVVRVEVRRVVAFAAGAVDEPAAAAVPVVAGLVVARLVVARLVVARLVVARLVVVRRAVDADVVDAPAWAVGAADRLSGETATAASAPAEPTSLAVSSTTSTAEPAACFRSTPIRAAIAATSAAASPAWRSRLSNSFPPADPSAAAASWRKRLASTLRAAPSFAWSRRSSRAALPVNGATAPLARDTPLPTAPPALETTPPTAPLAPETAFPAAPVTAPAAARDALPTFAPGLDRAIAGLPLLVRAAVCAAGRFERGPYHRTGVPGERARTHRARSFGHASSMTWLLIGLGGFAGAIARSAVDGIVSDRFPSLLPWGTFVVNISGSFLLGLLFALMTERSILPAELRGPVLIGFIGAYTTFSTYMLQSWQLIEAGAGETALLYAFGSIGAGLLAIVVGLGLGRAI